MNISSILKILLLLISSSLAWKYNEGSDLYNKNESSTENAYMTCDEFVKTKLGLMQSEFMVTYSISFHKSHNINEPLSPFGKDYSTCVWCQQNGGDCIKTGNVDPKKICTNKTYYMGPVNETCLLSQKEVTQLILNRKHKNEKTEGISPTESNWIIFLLPKSFPKTVHIPIGGFQKRNETRDKRYIDVCSFPDGLETASLDCRQYPSYVTCTQSCAFGYTLQGGIKQDLKCLKKENMWRPVGFVECQPFVDCTVALKSGGKAKCTYMSLKSPPTCTVSCSAYEDKDEVPSNTYSCNIQGKWEPPLPFCAIPGQGLMLTSAPKKKLHD